MNKKFSWKKLFVHLVLIAGIGVTIFPFVWMILTSFKTSGEAMQVPPTIIPKKFITTAYTQLTSLCTDLSEYDYFHGHYRIGTTSLLFHGWLCLCTD